MRARETALAPEGDRRRWGRKPEPAGARITLQAFAGWATLSSKNSKHLPDGAGAGEDQLGTDGGLGETGEAGQGGAVDLHLLPVVFCGGGDLGVGRDAVGFEIQDVPGQEGAGGIPLQRHPVEDPGDPFAFRGDPLEALLPPQERMAIAVLLEAFPDGADPERGVDVPEGFRGVPGEQGQDGIEPAVVEIIDPGDFFEEGVHRGAEPGGLAGVGGEQARGSAPGPGFPGLRRHAARARGKTAAGGDRGPVVRSFVRGGGGPVGGAGLHPVRITGLVIDGHGQAAEDSLAG